MKSECIPSVFKNIYQEVSPPLNLEALSNTINPLECVVSAYSTSNTVISVVHDQNAVKADAIITANSTEVLSCLQFKTYSGTSPVRLFRYLNKDSYKYSEIPTSFGPQEGIVVYDIGKVPAEAKVGIHSYLERRGTPSNCHVIDSTEFAPSSSDVYVDGYSILHNEVYDGRILGGIIKVTELGETKYEIYKYCSVSKNNMKLINSFDISDMSCAFIDFNDISFLLDLIIGIISQLF